MAIRALVFGLEPDNPIEPFVDPNNGNEILILRSTVGYFRTEPITPWEYVIETVLAQVFPDDLALVMKGKVTNAIQARGLELFGETITSGSIIFPDYSRGI